MEGEQVGIDRVVRPAVQEDGQADVPAGQLALVPQRGAGEGGDDDGGRPLVSLVHPCRRPGLVVVLEDAHHPVLVARVGAEVGPDRPGVLVHETVVEAQRTDDQVVHREPDRPPPVGVATEHPRVGLGRPVATAYSASPTLVEHPGEDAAEAILAEQRKLDPCARRSGRWMSDSVAVMLSWRAANPRASARKSGECSMSATLKTELAARGSNPTIERTFSGTADPSGRRRRSWKKPSSSSHGPRSVSPIWFMAAAIHAKCSSMASACSS